ncbi:MAG: hypothetical protein EOO74_03390 [Myxococcales bacterium]|nr:MAG: hypothetical protein EOO74_03390 [Myxococcales bacterium]
MSNLAHRLDRVEAPSSPSRSHAPQSGVRQRHPEVPAGEKVVTLRPSVVQAKQIVNRAVVLAGGPVAVARSSGVTHPMVARWLDEESTDLPNLKHLVEDGSGFARSVVLEMLDVLNQDELFAVAPVDTEAGKLLRRVATLILDIEALDSAPTVGQLRKVVDTMRIVAAQGRRVERSLAMLVEAQKAEATP